MASYANPIRHLDVEAATATSSERTDTRRLKAHARRDAMERAELALDGKRYSHTSADAESGEPFLAASAPKLV
jgi:hypothetical protein